MIPIADDVKFDLKEFRENVLQLNQLELANLLGIRQDNVSRMEKKPEQITYPVIVKLAKLSGLTLDQVIGYERPMPKALEVERMWDVKYHISALQVQINDFCAAQEQISPENQKLLYRMDELIKSVQKPKLGIAGGFASGKSTLINNLIGREIVPASPSFFIPFRIYLKHREDRPEYMNSDVYIMRRDGSGEVWNDEKLADEAYCRSWILDEGGLDKIVSYSVGVGFEYDLSEIESMLVFDDSKILRNCDIIRLPYQNSELLQGQEIFDRKNIALDILLYFMPLGEPLENRKIQHFKTVAKQLHILERAERSKVVCLSNLFILASKAHLFGTMAEAREAVAVFSSRLYDAIPSSYWRRRQDVSGLSYHPEEFYSRVFPYAVDGPEWRVDFEKELCRTFKTVSELAQEEIFKRLGACRDAICGELLTGMECRQKMIEGRAEYQSYIKELIKAEPVRWADNARRRDGLIDVVQRHKRNTRDELKRFYEEILSEQNVIRYLTDMNGRYGPAQMQRIASFLNAELETALQSVLEKAVRLFDMELEDYLTGFEAGITGSGFSVVNEFAYNLREKVSAGEIAQWLFAQNAGIDNVLYILEDAKAISGKRVYSQLLKVYFGEDVLGKNYLFIERFWEKVRVHFQEMNDKLENAWKRHLKWLENKVQEEDMALSKEIEEAQTLKNFLETISF